MSQVGRSDGGRAPPEIILDLSRLLSRVLRSAPTGIDRVEMAYAERLIEAGQASFAAVHPSGVYGRLPAAPVRRFIEETARRWTEGEAAASGSRTALRALIDLVRLTPARPSGPTQARDRPRRVYLLTSHHHLDRPAMVRRILEAEGARLVGMVHDLIPIEFPQYARSDGAAIHRRRMETLARFAAGVVTVSRTTRRSLETFFAQSAPAAQVEILAAPLGVTAPRAAAPSAQPYFVMLGTIEPRKNHLMALGVMRRLVRDLGCNVAPRLHIIGARGWGSQAVGEVLDRCDALRPVVREHNELPDRAVAEWLAGARALIMPSFAEGFGLPLAEALAMGAPAICSDIAALREVGAGAPDYLDPTHEGAWRDALVDYADLASPRRQAQMARIAAWRAPSWDDHFASVLSFIDRVC